MMIKTTDIDYQKTLINISQSDSSSSTIASAPLTIDIFEDNTESI
ncbi:33345_t:CDS:1, partial [Gigaspora margarita]